MASTPSCLRVGDGQRVGAPVPEWFPPDQSSVLRTVETHQSGDDGSAARSIWASSRGRKSRSRTKPGTLLKSQIPIRTWAEWNEDRPGFTEMDLVAHDGGNPRGEHAWTLNFTDIKTGWTECAAARNKAQIHVFAAIRLAQRRLPFPLVGRGFRQRLRVHQRRTVPLLPRGTPHLHPQPPGHKNDNAHVEQKNWSVVRRFVGDLRFDTPAQLKLLNQLYELLHFYVNFFLPVMKLKEKVRKGSKVKRIYDKPQTPYARVLASPHVSPQSQSPTPRHLPATRCRRLETTD